VVVGIDRRCIRVRDDDLACVPASYATWLRRACRGRESDRP
jgi:hypothetical protein